MVSNKANQKKATAHTLGCRLNQSESQVIREQLENADLAVINTCTITRESPSPRAP